MLSRLATAHPRRLGHAQAAARAAVARLALILALSLAPALAAAPATALARRAHSHSRPYTHRHPRTRPRAFASCTRLVDYANSHLAVTHGVPEAPVRALSEPTAIAPVPAGVRSPAPAAAPAAGEVSAGSGGSYSTTNNQEAGVDEPDIVKTDGHTVFAVEQGTLFAVDVSSGSSAPRLAGSLALGGSAYGAQLLLSGNRLLVISGRSALPVGVLRAAPATPSARGAALARPIAPPRTPPEPSPYFYAATTTVTEVDISNAAAMKVARTLTLDGTFVDARQNGATARLVIASAPSAIEDTALRARPSGWIPSRRFHSFISGHRFTLPVAHCGAIRRPVQFSGLGMLSIVTVDLDRGLYTEHATSLMADAQIVYGSKHNLFVATQRWLNPTLAPTALPSNAETVIDEFDARGPDTTTFVASGAVPGYLLNQFSLSEQDGYLRAATTSAPIWWEAGTTPSSQSYVTVLSNRGGVLTQVGQVAGLGAGQKIYSVRFIGDSGYVVTFRSVDPLYVIDLSSAAAPRVAGALELAGYSAYLHPVGPGLLLGVGEAVGSGNEPSGTQLELFDVSKPPAPQLLARTLLGEGSSSTVQYDHHAFLFWPPTSLAVLPVSIYTPVPVPLGAHGAPVAEAPGSGYFTGAIGFHVDRSGIGEIARIAHEPIDGYAPSIERSLVVGSRLYTLSGEGLEASDLNTLARVAFVAFPTPAPPPGSGTGVVPGATRTGG